MSKTKPTKMARRRSGEPVSGWVVLDKSKALTSTRAVGKVRKILNAQKAGHAGTLDPLATGILPIALGEATKTIPYVVEQAKKYRFTATFGEARDTDDSEGKIIATSEIRPEDNVIKEQLTKFTGTIRQVPPIYSAVWIDGERSYHRARKGSGRLPDSKIVRIDKFELVLRPDKDTAVFEVACGKGTYVRSLVRDLGLKLGTVAHVSKLRRTKFGNFIEKDAISLDQLSKFVLCAHPREYLLPVLAALDDIPALVLTETQTDLLRHGRSVRTRSGNSIFIDPDILETISDGDLLCAIYGTTPVALVCFKDGEIRPIRVLNL